MDRESYIYRETLRWTESHTYTERQRDWQRVIHIQRDKETDRESYIYRETLRRTESHTYTERQRDWQKGIHIQRDIKTDREIKVETGGHTYKVRESEQIETGGT